MIWSSKKVIRRVALVAAPVLAIAAGGIVYATVSNAAPTAANGKNFTAGRYVVTFAEAPVLGYDGSVAGYEATKPAEGQHIDPTSAKVKGWQKHLQDQHDALLSSVGASKIYDYTIAVNGVAANLSADQAAKLATAPGVISVQKDVLSQPDTTYSPGYLGLTAAGGLWEQLGGQENAGAGVVVGVIDSGIWPESASFASGHVPPGHAPWFGACQAGENFPVTSCNDKLIGARYYVEAFDKHNIADEDFLSPRDGSGHGSHTSSTAAGNANVPVVIDGNNLGMASGMAPAAKLAMYKVCWEGKPGIDSGCWGSDSVAAIDQAIADGVDVINYSIGGSSESSVLDAVSIEFFFATAAGIFVANSAGNSGPGASTLDHPAPWVTTVAASTYREAYNTVLLGNGARYVGASTTGVMAAPAPFIASTAAGLAGADATLVSQCWEGTLDPAKVTGKAVLCYRGGNARIDKSFAVKAAGGVAMIQVNTNANSLNGDYHAVPSVHLPVDNKAALEAYLATPNPTVQVVAPNAAELAAAPKAPAITDFSSRGPSTTTGGDILKPDLAAPGNDVVAAVAPPSNHGRNFDFYSGTSMASPHVAGLAALLKAAHPDWLPSEIKSALMTSAKDTVDGTAADDSTSPFGQGAGFVQPNGAAHPGLVYRTTAIQYAGYINSYGPFFTSGGVLIPPISGPQLNQASIAAGKVAGEITVTRTVKNVESTAGTYTASVSVPGFSAVVTPSTITVAPGASATFTVKLTRTTAALNEYSTGYLTWTSTTGKKVRSPIALRPVTVAAPTEVAGTGLTGSTTITANPGFTGTLTMDTYGLAKGVENTGSLVTGAFDFNAPNADADTAKYTVTVPAGSKAARFTLDVGDDSADFDLWVYVAGSTSLAGLVDYSATGSADEQVTFVGDEFADTTYDVYVAGFAVPGSGAYTLTTYTVGAPTGNLTVPASAPVTQGTPVNVPVSWDVTGTGAGKYLGIVFYDADTYTLISVTAS